MRVSWLALLAIAAADTTETCEKGAADCGCNKLKRGAGTAERVGGGGAAEGGDGMPDAAGDSASTSRELEEAGAEVPLTEMVKIPGGTFTMGTHKEEILTDGEGPERQVTVVLPWSPRCTLTTARALLHNPPRVRYSGDREPVRTGDLRGQQRAIRPVCPGDGVRDRGAAQPLASHKGRAAAADAAPKRRHPTHAPCAACALRPAANPCCQP